MPAAEVASLQDRLEALAAHAALEPDERIRDLRDIRDDIESLLGLADRLIGDQHLHQEAATIENDERMATLRENALIREELLRRGMASADELDAAGMLSNSELDAMAAEGVLSEALFGGQRVDPAKLAKIAKGRRRNAGKFADEFHMGDPIKTKGRGGAALPGGVGTRKPPMMEPGPQIPPRPSVLDVKGYGKDFIGGGPQSARPPAPKLDLPGSPSKPKVVPAMKGEPVDVGSDVTRAADLLSQGQAVRLSQPREASVLLRELSRRVKEAKAQGAEAPNFDLCKVSVKNTNLFCAESKGIQRIKMPQLSGKPLPGSKGSAMAGPDGTVDLTGDFRKMLEDNGATVNDETEKASFLKASQIELNGAKVAAMTEVLDNGGTLGGDPRIFVSHDNYIVDGHHRWAANVAHDIGDASDGDVEMQVARVDMDILELLAAANDFASDNGIPQAGAMQTPDEAKALASPGTKVDAPAAPAPQVDPARKAEIDEAIRGMYQPADAEPVNQQFADLDELFEAAAVANDQFKALLTEGLPDMIGAVVQGFEETIDTAKNNPSQPQVLMGPMKKRKRSQEKVEAQYKGDVNKLQDVVRATILVGGAGDLPDALEAVRARAAEQGWTIKGAQDKITESPPPPWVKGPTSAGYSDTKVFMIAPNGVAAELQFNTNSMFVAKETSGHPLYEEQRTIEASIKRRKKEAGARDALRADPSRLPEAGGLYFNTDGDALKEKYGLPKLEVTEVPLSKITPVRARPEGIANAKPLMGKAALGEGGKRDPITLVKDPDGGYRVYDGNSTFAIAQESDWSSIPAMVVESDEEAAAIEATAKEAKLRAKAEKAAKPAPLESPGTGGGAAGTVEIPYHGPTAAELRRLTALKGQQQEIYGAAREAGYGG